MSEILDSGERTEFTILNLLTNWMRLSAMNAALGVLDDDSEVMA